MHDDSNHSSRAGHAETPEARENLGGLAGRTGLEPATSGVTGRRYNQLNYRPNVASTTS